jgi:serine/threonine protein kinase
MTAEAERAQSMEASVNDSEAYHSVLTSWSEGREPDTLAALEQFPQLRLEKSMLLDLAYEEYTLKVKQGRQIDLNAFCARFPEHRSSVRKMIEVHLDLQTARNSLADPTEWPEAGALLGDYRLLRPLGRGGFARVFHAVHLLTDQHLVVKVAPANFKEPRLLGQLNHPNVAGIRDARVVPGGWSVLVMPYVGNSTFVDLLDVAFSHPGAVARGRGLVLRAARRNRQLSDPPVGDPPRDSASSEYFRAVLGLAAEVAAGLEYLHSKQIIHRDLKPSNVLLSWDGHPIILDFNLAEAAEDEQRRGAGTLYYMAPEQIERGLSKDQAADCTERADLYSFGVILYEILTGQHPFHTIEPNEASNSKAKFAESARRLLDRQRAGCAPPRQHDSTIDPAVDRLLMRCLSFEPAGRPESAREIRRELQRIQGVGHRWVRTVRKHSKVFALAGCLSLLAASYPIHSLVIRPPYKVRMIAHARRLLAEGKLEQARDELDEILKDDKDNVDARFLRSRIRLRLKDYEHAIYDLEALCKLEPNGRNHAVLAYAYALFGKLDASIHQAEIASDKFQFSHPALYGNRANCRIQVQGGGLHERVTAARKDLEKCFQLNPDFAPGYYTLAQLDFVDFENEKKNPRLLEHAITDIEKSIDMGFSNIPSHLFAVMCHMINWKNVQRHELVMKHVRILREAGFDLKPIMKLWYSAPFRGDPEFMAEVNKSTGGAKVEKGVALVDPLAGEVP